MIKTHKNGQKIRRSLLLTTSDQVPKYLKVFNQNMPSHLESSLQLIEDMNKNYLDKTKFNDPFSLDVLALYTSILPQESIRALEKNLDNFNRHCITSKHITPPSNIIWKRILRL